MLKKSLFHFLGPAFF